MFNKVEFKANKYDNIQMNETQLKSDDVVDYCVRISRSAKFKSFSNLVDKYQKSIKDKN